MCAGVQNVSRPMLSCHEMSHSTPSGMHVAPSTAITKCHGMAQAEAFFEASVNWVVAVDMSAWASVTEG